jgi:hypothetical protein
MANEATPWHDPRLFAGALIIVITAAMDFRVLIKGFPPGLDSTGVSFILGTWHALPIQIVQWMTGSSRASERQTELLAQATPAVTPNVAQTAADTEKKP